MNPLVAETNDGYLNDIRGRHVGREEVLRAIAGARGGPVEEGAVGAGTGTVAFGFKGGIGTASRKAGAYTVGVLVQTNFGGTLQMNGAPVGRELRGPGPNSGDGSCVMLVATDAPVDARNLRRMAARTMFGLARTGSSGANGSGDYGDRLHHRAALQAAPRQPSQTAIERRYVASVSGRDRGHRRGHLQLAAARGHDHGQRPHRGGAADRTDGRDPAPARSAALSSQKEDR